MNNPVSSAAFSSPSLTRQVFTGAAWTGGGQIGQIVIRLGVTIILARLLAPSDFGLAALAIVILTFCQIVAPLGTAVALVRLRDAGPVETKAAFTISIIMATLLAACATAAAYAMQTRIGLPGLGLATVCLLPAIYFDAIGRIASRTLQKRMEFRPETVANLLGYGVGYGGLGISLAYSGFGWLALCWAEVASVGVTTAYLVWAGRPPLGLSFDLGSWRRLIAFGAPATTANLVSWGSNNAPRLLIGALLGVTALGLYARAADLSTRLGALADRLCTTVVFAAFCQLNDDKVKLSKALSAFISLIMLVALPVSALLSTLAKPTMLLLFGEQWIGAVRAYQILAFLIPLSLVHRVSLVLANSLGRPGIGIRANLLALGVSSIGSAIGIRYGAEGVAIAVLAAFSGSSLLAFRLVAIELGLPIPILGTALMKGASLASGVYVSCILFEHAWVDLFGPLQPLQHLAIVIPTMCVILLLVWFVGRQWLFSQPASALIADAGRHIARKFTWSFGRS